MVEEGLYETSVNFFHTVQRHAKEWTICRSTGFLVVLLASWLISLIAGWSFVFIFICLDIDNWATSSESWSNLLLFDVQATVHRDKFL